jgi:transcriptional regulator with XRE-family HTH domain
MPARKRRKPDATRLLREEELIRQANEMIYATMKRRGVTKAELAKRMGKTPAYVTQILAENRNLTLRTIADIALALELRPSLILRDSQK